MTPPKPKGSTVKRNYRIRAKTLKKYGFIDYDLRKLTPQQKASVTRLWNKNKRLFDDTHTVVRTVSEKRVKQMKKLGYETRGRKVFIPTEGYDPKNIRVKGNTIRYIAADRALYVKVMDTAEIFKELDRLEKKKLPPGMFVTAQIGSNSAFSQRFDSIELMRNYLRNWQPKDEKWRDKKDELLGQMQIVQFYAPDHAEVPKRKRLKGWRGKRKR